MGQGRVNKGPWKSHQRAKEEQINDQGRENKGPWMKTGATALFQLLVFSTIPFLSLNPIAYTVSFHSIFNC